MKFVMIFATHSHRGLMKLEQHTVDPNVDTVVETREAARPCNNRLQYFLHVQSSVFFVFH